MTVGSRELAATRDVSSELGDSGLMQLGVSFQEPDFPRKVARSSQNLA